MTDKDAIRQAIRSAFDSVAYPGDNYLRNSQEGDEPFLLEDDFRGKEDWTVLDPAFIDQAPAGFASALSFFSAAAFRFYLPAYLIADLDGQLQYTDPLFHLCHGLTNDTKDLKVNPRRYADYTWYDYASERFAAFGPDEARAIVAYLRWKYDEAITDFEKSHIEQALENYWIARAERSAADS